MKYTPWIIAAVTILVAVYSTIVRADAEVARTEAKNQATELSQRVAELEAEREKSATGGAEERVERVEPADSDYVWPIAESDTRLTSPYGIRESPFVEDSEAYHTGVDIAGVWKAQVVSIASGTVVEHWPPPGTPYPGGGEYKGHDTYGGMVQIRHADGSEALYAHLSSTRVHQGMRVGAGEMIGRQGDTGRADGAHVHLEMIVDGERTNPLQYLQGGN